MYLILILVSVYAVDTWAQCCVLSGGLTVRVKRYDNCSLAE